MMHAAPALADNHRVRLVSSFDELVSTRFAGDINALCWQRSLPGDFHAIVDHLQPADGIAAVTPDRLASLDLGPDAARARETLLSDQALLSSHGLDPSLECISGNPRQDRSGPIPTDVYSFHVDSAPVEADTYLCTYAGACSQGLLNEDAIRRIDDTETRALLLRGYGGADDAAFADYLAEHCYDLHFAPRPSARVYDFGVGNMWRIAIAHPASPVLACIHRAPLSPPGAPARLLLIS